MSFSLGYSLHLHILMKKILLNPYVLFLFMEINYFDIISQIHIGLHHIGPITVYYSDQITYKFLMIALFGLQGRYLLNITAF